MSHCCVLCLLALATGTNALKLASGTNARQTQHVINTSNAMLSRHAGDGASRNEERGSFTQKANILWKPIMRGGELHEDVHEMLTHDNASSRSPQLDYVLKLVAPGGCRCDVERFDQYAVCKSSFDTARRAYSFGVNGYDPWGKYVSSRTHVIPQLFDCFNTHKPVNFHNEFFPTCLNGSTKLVLGKSVETLPRLTTGAGNASLLIKMDIEESEYNVFEAMSTEDFARIGSLSVEYHFNHACADPFYIARAERVLQKVRRELEVIDAAAGYYHSESCKVGGKPFPKVLAVSYAARSHCSKGVSF